MAMDWVNDILVQLSEKNEKPVETIRHEMEEYLEEFFSRDCEETRRIRMIFGGRRPGLEEYISYLTDQAILKKDKQK